MTIATRRNLSTPAAHVCAPQLANRPTRLREPDSRYDLGVRRTEPTAAGCAAR
jgi:hypothetical protein